MALALALALASDSGAPGADTLLTTVVLDRKLVRDPAPPRAVPSEAPLPPKLEPDEELNIESGVSPPGRPGVPFKAAEYRHVLSDAIEENIKWAGVSAAFCRAVEADCRFRTMTATTTSTESSATALTPAKEVAVASTAGSFELDPSMSVSPPSPFTSAAESTTAHS
jgi:hypothetical protein